ncbi:MAG: hypothetical protein E7626_04935 [Ruminococcaceae bacterium]|nr:hypothetical protein [Oscillospiraceae bacterium]
MSDFGYFKTENGVISNGKTLVYCRGTEISEIRRDGVPILSVFPDFGDSLAKTESGYDSNFESFSHDVFTARYSLSENGERIPEILRSARICDGFSESGAFTRSIETLKAFEMKLSFPPYVRKSFIRNYKIGRKYYDVICLTLPSGVGFYKCETTASAVKTLIVPSGNARFSQGGDALDIMIGTSRITIASGEGEYPLKQIEKALCERCDFTDNTCENECDPTENLLHILKAHQSEKGGVIASRGEPIVRTDSVRMVVAAFLKYKLFDRARRVLEFFCERFGADKRFYQIYSAENKQSERYFSDVSLGCANLMSAMLDYARESGDHSLLKENIKMMKSAMYAQFDECEKGVMPFSGAETELADFMISLQSRAQASLEATLSFVCAVLDFCDYCEEKGVKLPNDNGSARRRATEILASVSERFIHNSVPTLASRERLIKLPRFSYGDCDVCRAKFSHIYYGELELTHREAYACPRCYADSDETFPITTPSDGFSVLAAAILLSNERFCATYGEDKSRALLEKALEIRYERGDVTSVRADTLLLCAARRFGVDAKFLEKEILSEVKSGTLVNECFDTRTAAALLLVL